MVKIERTPTPPKSLAIESQKAWGSYSERDVIEQLQKDFHDKCYICELKQLTDVEVEHLRPHHNRSLKERVFDWNNLFYSCPHCNSIKNNRKYDDRILDCCTVDPESLLKQIYAEGNVIVQPLHDSTDENVLMTADLIQSCFGKDNTGIRTIQCAARVEQLANTMNSLYKALEQFKQDKTSRKYLSALRGMLKRDYKFAAFTRYYVRSHSEDYPELQEFLS